MGYLNMLRRLPFTDNFLLKLEVIFVYKFFIKANMSSFRGVFDRRAILIRKSAVLVRVGKTLNSVCCLYSRPWWSSLKECSFHSSDEISKAFDPNIIRSHSISSLFLNLTVGYEFDSSRFSKKCRELVQLSKLRIARLWLTIGPVIT